MHWRDFDLRLVRVLEASYDIVTNGGDRPVCWDDLLHQVSVYMPGIGFEPWAQFEHIPAMRMMQIHIKKYVDAGMPWEGVAAPTLEPRNETTCVRGHEWTPENTYVRANGTKYCRACRKATKAA